MLQRLHVCKSVMGEKKIVYVVLSLLLSKFRIDALCRPICHQKLRLFCLNRKPGKKPMLASFLKTDLGKVETILSCVERPCCQLIQYDFW
jgi:hypothetical protein